MLQQRVLLCLHVAGLGLNEHCRCGDESSSRLRRGITGGVNPERDVRRLQIRAVTSVWCRSVVEKQPISDRKFYKLRLFSHVTVNLCARLLLSIFNAHCENGVSVELSQSPMPFTKRNLDVASF